MLTPRMVTVITAAAVILVLVVSAWPAGARDLTTADVRRAWHQASYRAQIRAARSYYARPPFDERTPMFWPARKR